MSSFLYLNSHSLHRDLTALDRRVVCTLLSGPSPSEYHAAAVNKFSVRSKLLVLRSSKDVCPVDRSVSRSELVAECILWVNTHRVKPVTIDRCGG